MTAVLLNIALCSRFSRYLKSDFYVKGKIKNDPLTSSPFDEDGVRVVYDSSPTGKTKERRQDWKRATLNEKVSWTQTSTDITVYIKLPKGKNRKN